MNFQTRKLCILYTISLQLVSCMMSKIWRLLEIAIFLAVIIMVRCHFHIRILNVLYTIQRVCNLLHGERKCPYTIRERGIAVTPHEVFKLTLIRGLCDTLLECMCVLSYTHGYHPLECYHALCITHLGELAIQYLIFKSIYHGVPNFIV